MLAAGSSMADVQRETGWMKDKNGEWGYSPAAGQE